MWWPCKRLKNRLFLIAKPTDNVSALDFWKNIRYNWSTYVQKGRFKIFFVHNLYFFKDGSIPPLIETITSCKLARSDKEHGISFHESGRKGEFNPFFKLHLLAVQWPPHFHCMWLWTLRSYTTAALFQSVEANFYRGYWYRMYCAIVINNLNQSLKLLILKIPLFSGFVTGLCFFYLWNLGLPVIILTM